MTFRNNAISTHNVLRLAPERGVDRVMWASSETVVGLLIEAFGSSSPGLFLPDIVQWLPFDAATAVLGEHAGIGGPGVGVIEVTALDPNTALVVVAA